MPRRSSTMMFSAFLFEANSAQVLAKFSDVIGLLLIEFLATDNFFHSRRYEIANRSAGGNSRSNFRGGDVDFQINQTVGSIVGGYSSNQRYANRQNYTVWTQLEV